MKQDEEKKTYPVDLGDTYGGPLDHGDITLEEPSKGQFFDKLWGAE